MCQALLAELWCEITSCEGAVLWPRYPPWILAWRRMKLHRRSVELMRTQTLHNFSDHGTQILLLPKSFQKGTENSRSWRNGKCCSLFLQLWVLANISRLKIHGGNSIFMKSNYSTWFNEKRRKLLWGTWSLGAFYAPDSSYEDVRLLG